MKENQEFETVGEGSNEYEVTLLCNATVERTIVVKGEDTTDAIYDALDGVYKDLDFRENWSISDMVETASHDMIIGKLVDGDKRYVFDGIDSKKANLSESKDYETFLHNVQIGKDKALSRKQLINKALNLVESYNGESEKIKSLISDIDSFKSMLRYMSLKRIENFICMLENSKENELSLD